MNISQEQYEADIRRAAAQALRDAADLIDDSHAPYSAISLWLDNRADELEGGK